MRGMREYLMGSPCGKNRWYEEHPHKNKRREPHGTGEHTTATKHTTHKPDGTKSASGMPTRASIHKQGMAREHAPEPAAANATRIEGPRMG